jgi:diguanylate cyclase (GGDEF)-like protein/PAS domain S-box-containing protein
MTQQQIRKLVDGQQVVSFENRHRCKDGSYRWLLWNATSEPERGLTYAVARDITERKRNEEQLALLGQAVQHASDAVLITDAHLDPPGPQIVFVNPAFCRMSSYAPEDIIGQTPRILQGPDTDTEPLQQLKQALVQGEPFTGETVNYRQDGTPYHVEWRISPIRNDAGTITHYVSVQRDVTARAYAHMLETDRQAVLEAMVRGETFSAVLRRIVQMLEHQFPQIHGAIEVYSNNHLLYQVAPNLPSTYRAALDSLRETRQGVPWEGSFIQHQMMIIDDIASERRWRRWCTLALEHSFQSCWMIPIVQPADNTYGVVILYASEPVSPDAHAAALIETARQMTALALEWQRLNERLIYHVSHDALTGLPNRIHFLEHVQQTIVQAKPAEHMLAVCFIDLDRFTRINDTLGHIVGDQVLQHVATRFQATIQESDILARIGDDTFALMLTSVHNVRDAVHSAQQLLATLDAPFHIEERNLFLTASIGISFYPQDGSDAQILLNNADGALHRAKVNGVNTVMCFAPEMTTLALERLEMENQLRVALNQGGLMVYYQPQIDLMSGKVVGVEGLIRWRHPKRGIISPANFIPLAEESGLIIPMGAWILQEVCRQAMVWQRAGLPPMRVAVNISALQLEHEDFVAHVTHALQSSGLDPALLDLEITESIMMRDHETGALRLRQVEELGVRVSIDDFGTGYSSLAYLQQLPVDCLKIDRVFIHNLTREEVTASNRPQNMTALVQTVVTLAHNFGLKVIAEGIDSPAQVAYLRQIGCDEGQGFLFGKPMPARDLEALLRQRAHMVDFFCLPSDTIYER